MIIAQQKVMYKIIKVLKQDVKIAEQERLAQSELVAQMKLEMKQMKK